MKSEKILYSLIMAIQMSLLMSAVMTIMGTGIDKGFIERWMQAFYTAAPIAFIAILILKSVASSISRALLRS